MKTLNKLFILLVAMGVSVTACDSDSSSAQEETEIPLVEANTQGTSDGNQVIISNINSPEAGWVVVHRTNADGNGPQVPEIIGKTQVDAGVNTDVHIQLKEGVANDETLWAMLHEDTGKIGTYEFDGQSGLDLPIIFNDKIVMSPFMITQTDPAIMVSDQVNMGNIFTVSVDAAEDGWIVIHASNAAGNGPQVPEIIGKASVKVGMNSDVQIMLKEDAQVAVGDQLYPMLHYDTGKIGTYEFDGQSGLDLPVTFGGNIVLSSFEVLENTSTLTANDQTVMNNSIMVDVNSNTDGWVVIHRSVADGSGPQVPEIIGKSPIKAGMNTDVEIMFRDGEVIEDGEKIWPMVHYDTGEIGTYEFDGQSGLDQPVITANGILLTSIMVQGSTPSVVVEDQAVENGTLTISEALANNIGFVVLHRDTGSDAPVVPASIGHGQVYIGKNADLQISLDEDETLKSGDKVWAMLHIDNGTIGSYDFDGSAESDDPPVFDEMDNIVMVQFTIQ